MSPFRLFGHAPDAPSAAPDLDTDLGRDADVSWAPGPWTAGRGDEAAGTATRHARPVAFGRGAGPARVDDDPPTDPYGFPPLPAAPVERMPELRPVPATSAPPPPDPLEAAALAGAFAVDYLSWDEDDPGRRARSLADHLAAPVADPGRLGWDGRGRQRADFALPGLVRADGDDRVLVDVRVRVTPYREVATAADRAADRRADGAEAADAEPDVPGTPAAAPAPSGRGWRGCASSWVRLSVPVVREDGCLGVDAADEASEPATDIGDTEERDAADRDDRSTTVGTTVHPLPGEREPDDRPLRAPLANPESAW